MTPYILFLLLGLGSGAVYTLFGLGIVLEYRSSGVVNFAHGAMGMIIAYVYVQLTSSGSLWLLVGSVPLGSRLSLWPALAICAVYAAVLGILVYAVVFRPLRTASALGKAVATVGLALALEAVAELHFGSSSVSASPILPTKPAHFATGLVVPGDRLWLTGIAVALAVLLWGASRFTHFGIATRAAAESEKGAILLGYSPNRIAAANWVLATVLAGVSGILFIQISSLAPNTYTELVVPALAAAMVARFTSFGWVVVASVVLGMLQSEMVNFNAHWSWVPVGAGGILPFIMILIAMAVRGQVLPSRGVLLERRAPKVGHPRQLGLGTGAGLALGLIGLFALSSNFRMGLIQSMITAILCLSLVLLTGYAGQVSLAQMAFAGIGAFTLAKLAIGTGVGFPITLLVSGLVAVPIGLLVGLPALRVRGINLAIATLAGGFAVDQYAFNASSFVGGAAGLHIPRLTLLGLNLDINGRTSFQFPRPVFGVVVLVILTLLALSVANLRRTATGRHLLAIRANERAAAAAGVNVAGCKLFAFVISAFIAGIGGGLMAYQIGNLSPSAFDIFTSLTLLAVVFIGGTARIAGAIAGAVLLATGGLVPTLLQHVINFGSYQQLVAGGLLVMSAILYPDGIAATWDAPMAAVRRLLTRHREPPAVEAADVSPETKVSV